jgi:hypothetical protein
LWQAENQLLRIGIAQEWTAVGRFCASGAAIVMRYGMPVLGRPFGQIQRFAVFLTCSALAGWVSGPGVCPFGMALAFGLANRIARMCIDIGCKEAQVSKGWQKIVERSGEPNLGATLIRLAHMAASVHQAEAARELTEQHQDHGRVLWPQSPAERGAVCTEASR